MDDPRFKGVRNASEGIQGAREALQSALFHVDIDLTTARSLALGTALPLSISGNSLYVDQRSNSGAARLFYTPRGEAGSTPVTIYPGWIGYKSFVGLYLENEAQPGVSLRLIYGTDIDFRSSSGAGVSLLTPVSVIDGNKARTLALSAFWGVNNAGPVAAQNSHLQLKMQAGTAKRFVLEQYWVYSATAGQINVGTLNTDLATLNVAPISKLFGPTAIISTVQQRSTTNAGSLIVVVTDQLNIVAGERKTITLREPVIIQPGFGFGAVHIVVNAQLQMGVLDGYEEADA